MKLEIPASENPKGMLDALIRDIVEVREEIEDRKRLIDALVNIAEENKVLEGRITEAKRIMFMLLHEKVQVATARNIGEYINLIEQESTALIVVKKEVKK